MKTKNKYKAIKTTVDGIEFDSRKEAQRYRELLLLERAGVIQNLRMQVKYVLIPAHYEVVERFGKNGQRLKSGERLIEKECAYIADFVYEENGKTIVEDVKGYRNGAAYNLFKIKRKLMLDRHNIRVREV